MTLKAVVVGAKAKAEEEREDPATTMVVVEKKRDVNNVFLATVAVGLLKKPPMWKYGAGERRAFVGMVNEVGRTPRKHKRLDSLSFTRQLPRGNLN